MTSKKFTASSLATARASDGESKQNGTRRGGADEFGDMLVAAIRRIKERISEIDEEMAPLVERREAAETALHQAQALQDWWHLNGSNVLAAPAAQLLPFEAELVGMSLEQALHRIAAANPHGVVDMTAAVPILQRTKLIPEDHPHPARTLARSLGQSSRFERMRTGVYRLVQRDAE